MCTCWGAGGRPGAGARGGEGRVGARGTGRAERESGASQLRLACDGGFESISGGGDLVREFSRDIRSGAVGEVLSSADSSGTDAH